MQELSLNKKMKIIRLYLKGYPYDEIASKSRASKGTVANVITALKAGQFPEISSTPEELEQLRDLAIKLKHSGLSPVQATVGLSLLSKLNNMGMEPAEIAKCHTLLKALSSPDSDPQVMATAVLTVEGLKESTGLTLEELEAKVSNLKEELIKLEPLSEEVKHKEKQLSNLNNAQHKLQKEISRLKEYLKEIKDIIKDKEKREAELSTRVTDLEKRAYEADKELYEARQDLKNLSRIGMTAEDLGKFIQKLKVVSAHHNIKPEELSARLLHELKQLDKGLSLESIVKKKKAQLAAISKGIAKEQYEKEHLIATKNQLNSERIKLEAQLAESRKHLAQDIGAINKTSKDAIEDMRINLRSGIDESLREVHGLAEEALKVGGEFGQLKADIESYSWVKSLLSIVRGDDGLDNYQVRVVSLTVLRNISTWINQKYGQDTNLYLLKSSLANTISELERWEC